jgi:hypothetical protein
MNFDDGQRYWDDKPSPTDEQIAAVSELVYLVVPAVSGAALLRMSR